MGLAWSGGKATMCVRSWLMSIPSCAAKVVFPGSTSKRLRLEHLANACVPTCVSLAGSVTVSICEQPLKAASPMVCNEVGRVMYESEEQPAKADAPMCSSVAGSDTLLTSLQRQKALSSMRVTAYRCPSCKMESGMFTNPL